MTMLYYSSISESTNYRNEIVYNWLRNKYLSGIHINERQFYVNFINNCDNDLDLDDFIYRKICSLYPEESFRTMTTYESQFTFESENVLINCYKNNLKEIWIRIWGSISDIRKLEQYQCSVSLVPSLKWHSSDNKGNVIITDFEIKDSLTVCDEFYPFINDTVDNYFNKFTNSSSSILILMGEPGTGKTSFVRQYIKNIKAKCFYTFDEFVMKNDSFYVNFLTDTKCSIMIVEDADILLSSRELHNNVMTKFLNASDGLIKLENKKIIFTTNLQKLNSIDDAIMRPGRCFDVLNFRKLTLKEANVICSKYSLDLLQESKEYSLGEIFNRYTSNTNKTKTGFM